MKFILLAIIALATAGCSTYTPHPSKRPLSQETISQLGASDISIYENNSGIAVSWFRQDSSAAGAQFGLLGALTVAAVDAIANSGPSTNARKAAGEINSVVTLDWLNRSLYEAVEKLDFNDSSLKVTGLGMSQPIGAGPLKNTLTISTGYRLSESANALQVTAVAQISSDDIPYVTPYEFENGKIPKAQKSGPIYLNTFVYESDRLPLPVLTDELKEELIARITARYSGPNGELPEEGSDERKALVKEYKQAKDNKLSKYETALFLTRNWTDNNGELAMSAITDAHQFIAEQIIQDLNRRAIPSYEGEDEVLEMKDDGRLIVLKGNGAHAGAVHSLPGDVSDFSSYGNAFAIAEANADRIKEMKKVAEANEE